MIAALVIGKHNSGGVPGKNFRPLLGRPMVQYPLMAARHCRRIERTFVSTDSPVIKKIASGYAATVIDRPAELARAESPTEFVFQHAYQKIKAEVGPLQYLVLMFANSPDVLPEYLEQAMDKLDADDSLDSVVSVSNYNMFTPLRARRLNDDGTTTPVLDLDSLGIPNTFDRDAMGNIYFCDFGVQVVRPERCLLDATVGALPFRWLGQKQGAIAKDFGFDVDVEWQIPVLEHWLLKHGFTETTTPYEAA
jgi:CMP-N-acetylneuraminic acid synthetase